jgi:predicted nucleic acid-binding protein
VRFWDTSALVPLLAEEPATPVVQRLYGDAPAVVWWGTPVECASAVARLERDAALSPAQVVEALGRLDALRASWIEIEPGDEVREVARRMLRVHPLRAGDALQLAAAWLAAERRPPSLPLVSLDERLRAAAAREGFPLVDL